ncbi:hypothetical protein J2X26_002228 [Cellulomonas humilata]|uniref:Uncharacterized protein n=1 Tax=Cellulomonas humilata TaxID=144055 RepID=A0ABU0EFB5_9CELL|nr:hypothetical protein [Cellulomonas humilata]
MVAVGRRAHVERHCNATLRGAAPEQGATEMHVAAAEHAMYMTVARFPTVTGSRLADVELGAAISRTDLGDAGWVHLPIDGAFLGRTAPTCCGSRCHFANAHGWRFWGSSRSRV